MRNIKKWRRRRLRRQENQNIHQTLGNGMENSIKTSPGYALVASVSLCMGDRWVCEYTYTYIYKNRNKRRFDWCDGIFVYKFGHL